MGCQSSHQPKANKIKRNQNLKEKKSRGGRKQKANKEKEKEGSNNSEERESIFVGQLIKTPIVIKVRVLSYIY